MSGRGESEGEQPVDVDLSRLSPSPRLFVSPHTTFAAAQVKDRVRL